jgi:hypothetical protein
LTKHALHLKALMFLDTHELGTLTETLGHHHRPDAIEEDLLITQLISFMDPRTKRILLARVCGQSWADIGADLGTSANGAQVMYNRGVRLVRERVHKRAWPWRKNYSPGKVS